MSKTLFLALVTFVMIFSAGCSSEPTETTVKIDGLNGITQSLQNNAVLEMKPAAIQLGENSILYIPTGSFRDGHYAVKYNFYELNDGKFEKIEFAQPGSE